MNGAKHITITLALSLALAALLAWPALQDRGVAETQSMIVKADSLERAIAAVEAVGGTITHELGIIDSVAGELTAEQVEALRARDGVRRVSGNRAVTTAGKPGSDTTIDNSGNTVIDSFFPSLVDADLVHAENNLGWNAAIAVLDTGLWKHDGTTSDSNGSFRLDMIYDAINNEYLKERATSDAHGHGSHVTSVAASSLLTDVGLYNGIAPGAGIVSIVAFDQQGHGTYADVIRGIDFAVQNTGWIRVLNMSIGAPVQSHYWDDPLNEAVMRAWQAGLVVVTSAGNGGPDAQSVNVPGNVPYVITVGAMTDADTPADGSDDRLATFSAAGPTYEGFVKPEIVAPGGHMLGLMDGGSTLATTYPQFYDGGKYFTMSGTSQAAAVVSGIVALMLTADVNLSPDDVKCRLMASAEPATNPDGTLAYSIFQQGAGMVNAYAAVHSTATGCANQGLNIDLDLADVQHYGGRANQNPDGTYYLMGMEGDGYTWDGAFSSATGYIFTDGYVWTDGFVFTDAYLFTDGTVGTNGYVWTDGYTFTDGYTWTDGYIFTDVYPFTDSYPFTDTMTEPMSVEVWVPQE
jgi:serine protease AprX